MAASYGLFLTTVLFPRGPAALAEALACIYLSRGFFHKRQDRHVGRRRQGDIADPVAADAHHPVALDRAGAGADYGAGHWLAARLELVCRLRRGLGGDAAWAGLPHHAPRPVLDHLDRG